METKQTKNETRSDLHMNTLNVEVKYDNSGDNYPQFSDKVREQFAKFSAKPLFTTDVEGLFDIFLQNLPSEARQHYNCRCCRQFIERFGGLVSITEKGGTQSVMWDEKIVPPFFKDAANEMKQAVQKANVNGIFVSSEAILGTKHTNGWDHMHVILPPTSVHRDRNKSDGQTMAQHKENYKMLANGIESFAQDHVNTAIELINSGSLNRKQIVEPIASFLGQMHVEIKGKKANVRKNLIWLATATNPEGFFHIKNGMIGTLLSDIEDGYGVQDIINRFNDKVSGQNYMRAQSAPDAGNIKQAERIIEERGLAQSLRRTYARFEELPVMLWRGVGVPKKVEAKSGGVFGNIAPKVKTTAASNGVEIPQVTMTWEKFSRTMIHDAQSIEVKVDNPNRFMALVTAADKEAPNILEWDNTYSWYYHGGIDGEIKKRVEQAGGQYTNNEIRCSLIWENYSDLDLHCITPDGRHIYYGNKRVGHGWLDVDMNVSPTTNKPVENIRWSQGTAQEGSYRFYVRNFTQRGNDKHGMSRYGTTPFKVELEVAGKIFTFHGELSHNHDVTAFEFRYKKGETPQINGSSIATSNGTWNVPSNSFVKVKGITTSPNLWGENPKVRAGQHVFFLLEDCVDLSEGKGRGFFVETLQRDLHEIRKTLEAYTANTPIEGVENASACGVGYSMDSEWNLIVKVTKGNSTQLVKIDRWD